MHGINTLKYLNDQAVAQAILAKHKDPQAIDPTLAEAVKVALAEKAKNVTK